MDVKYNKMRAMSIKFYVKNICINNVYKFLKIGEKN